MLGGFTNNANPAVAPDYLAILANFFYAASDFHKYGIIEMLGVFKIFETLRITMNYYSQKPQISSLFQTPNLHSISYSAFG